MATCTRFVLQYNCNAACISPGSYTKFRERLGGLKLDFNGDKYDPFFVGFLRALEK